ncbi:MULTISPECIES: conjugal transfer mating-pair stabilization protein TraG [Enterobacteriaceae]|jgi:conjugal transfer mating pair stabilization protein TraG|uniref:conjugal transfer mating-pair stabilization protein TraG n=1 Tax=Enterobacteriaceae TaxID=543 RepID=UPI0005424E24|nr:MULTISPECIES: conjugal transfer mating-pair stabilization protein TraG [Enterobacteriaceae]HDX0298978.1 conjugal transfer mating pair stabilization protein TraG [Shigella sonnei]AVP32175.1 conjugal transfer protein TraG [Escherichia coli]EFB6357901.1 conjugal transfer mating pair stabilization protein TraG [Escherichia coli]EFI4136433.1 conjugal transfer mating pair stabilization protein TraG [Escherichia coli]EFO4368070.1 conjugal transfer mating pair stabilization protein TraG [Escherichi
MAIDTIYTIAGGAWFQDTLNGVASFLDSRAGDALIAMATAVSVIVGAATYIRTRNIMDLVKWAGFYVLVIAVLIGDKRSVQIIDLSEPARIYQVDNVPAGLAAPASMITRIGAGMAQTYDTIFARPDALTYSKTGMLFGAQLAAGSSDFRFSEPEIQRMFSDYVHNCVVGDIMLNNKYTIGELMNAADPYALIFSRPSPLRGLYDKNRNFLTCEQAATRINTDSGDISGANTSPFLKQILNTLHGFTDQVFGQTNGAQSALFTEMLGDSYNYFHRTSLTSTEIIRKNVIMNGLRSGLESFSALSGDTAGLVNVATQTSMAKMRLSQATSASIAANTLPVMYSVLLGMTIALFPVLIVLAVVSSLSWTIIKGYVYTIAYLQMWPILFSILNHAMNFYLQGKLSGTAVTLANFDQVQNTYSDIGTTAGWLALSIPFIAWGMVKGLGQVVSQAGNYLGQTLQSASTQSSSQTIDGNWHYNNMTTGNVQGNKWDTNYSHREGHMTSQLESGAMKTLTSSGQSVYNTTEAISKLPVDIALGKTATSSWQQQQRDAMSEAQSLTNSLSQTSSLAASQMSQWSQQRGNSDTTVAGSDISSSSNLTKALNTIQSIGNRYARDENVSLAEAVREAATKSQEASAGGGLQVSFDTDRHILGKIGGLATGLKGSAEGHVKYAGRSGSSHGTSSDLTRQGGSSKGFSAQELKDFRDAMDVVASSRVTDSGSHTDNESASLASQLSSTFSSLKSQASQYNDAVTRSHEYAQLASYAENNSANINQNYSQEFVGYVTSQRPGEADQLLSDTASPEVRAERERLVQAFVEERIKPQLLQQFEQNKARTGEGMGSVSSSSGGGDLESEYQVQQMQMENRANESGVRQQGDVSGDVSDKRRHAESQVHDEKNTVISSGNTQKEEYNRLQSEHEQGNKEFDKAKKEEEYRQSAIPLDAGEAKENIDKLKNEMIKRSDF